MHVVYREVSVQDAHRILDYCRRHTIKEGGLFEVYSTPGQDIHMIIVNSCPEDEPLEKFRPLGAFYLNYLNPGTISMEEDDPHFDGAPRANTTSPPSARWSIFYSNSRIPATS